MTAERETRRKDILASSHASNFEYVGPEKRAVEPLGFEPRVSLVGPKNQYLVDLPKGCGSKLKLGRSLVKRKISQFISSYTCKALLEIANQSSDCCDPDCVSSKVPIACAFESDGMGC